VIASKGIQGSLESSKKNIKWLAWKIFVSGKNCKYIQSYYVKTLLYYVIYFLSGDPTSILETFWNYKVMTMTFIHVCNLDLIMWCRTQVMTVFIKWMTPCLTHTMTWKWKRYLFVQI